MATRVFSNGDVINVERGINFWWCHMVPYIGYFGLFNSCLFHCYRYFSKTKWFVVKTKHREDIMSHPLSYFQEKESSLTILSVFFNVSALKCEFAECDIETSAMFIMMLYQLLQLLSLFLLLLYLTPFVMRKACKHWNKTLSPILQALAPQIFSPTTMRKKE